MLLRLPTATSCLHLHYVHSPTASSTVISIHSTASSVAGTHVHLYYTKFELTNESRAGFVRTNLIEVPWKKRKEEKENCGCLPPADPAGAGGKTTQNSSNNNKNNNASLRELQLCCYLIVIILVFSLFLN